MSVAQKNQIAMPICSCQLLVAPDLVENGRAHFKPMAPILTWATSAIRFASELVGELERVIDFGSTVLGS